MRIGCALNPYYNGTFSMSKKMKTINFKENRS